MKMSRAPSPIQISRLFTPRSGPNRLQLRAAKPSVVVSAAPVVRKRAKRDGGSVAPSRTAAIGGTRVARSAGRRLATSVTRMPTSSETTIVRASKMSPWFGSVKPTASNSLNRPLARARPRKRPVTDATEPRTSDSTTIAVSTCRREPPSVRTVANSRVRCAIVIESEFAITKLPTKSAIPPNASRKPRRKEMNEFVSEASSCACCEPVFACAVGGRIARTFLRSCASDTPGFAATAISSSLPGLSNSFCAVGTSKPASVAPPIVETEPNLISPETRRRVTGPSAWTPIV